MLLAKISRRALLAAILALPATPAAAQAPLAYADDLAATAREAAARRVPVMIVFTVGLLAADFYRLHLEHAIEEALFKLRSAR